MFFGVHNEGSISKSNLLKAAKEHPENLLRLAEYLKLTVEGMSADQTARLIHWRLSRQKLYG